MAFVYRPHGVLSNVPVNPKLCAASVSYADLWRSHQCRRPGKLEEDGYLWCKQHAPSSEKARQEKSDQRFREHLANHPVTRLSNVQKRLTALQAAVETFVDGWPNKSSVVYLAAALKESRE